MNAIFTVSLATFRELIRNKILHSVFAFLALLLAVSALFGSVTIGDRIAVIKDFGLFALSLAGCAVVVISGVSLLDKELKQKTIYNVLSKPLSRGQFIAGKFLGLSLLVSVLVAIMGIGFIVFATLFEGTVDTRLFQGILLVIFEQIILAAVAIFFSSLVITTSLAGLFTFSVYLAGHSLAALKQFSSDSDPTSFKARLLAVTGYLLPDLSTFNQTSALLYQSGVTGEFLLWSCVYSASYAACCVILSAAIFRLRDFN